VTFADIITSELELADVCFLVAFILFVVAALIAFFQSRSVVHALGFAAGAFLAFGLMAL
jgi:hypothetical protein